LPLSSCWHFGLLIMTVRAIGEQFTAVSIDQR